MGVCAVAPAINPDRKAVLAPEDERLLAAQLAEAVLAQAAPEELVIFDETAEEYFQDPERVLRARGGDEAVGFGLDMALLTPYVLAVAGSVVTFLASIVVESAKDETKTVVAGFVRRLFRGQHAMSSARAAAPQPLTAEQMRRIHQIAYDQSIALSLPEDRATVLANAVVGGILVAD
jgi:hypothetical protein